MKIVFIRPNWSSIKYPASMEPLVFAVLAGMTPPVHSIVLYDEQIEDIDYSCEADLVCLTVDTFSASASYRISERFLRRGIQVLLGGFHPSILPEEALKHCTSVCIGDAESVWPEILKDAQNRTLKQIYRGKQGDFQNIIPDRSIFKKKAYGPFSIVQFGRGCCFQCDFCSIQNFYNKKYYFREVADIVKEIKGIDKKFLFIVDDNLISNIEVSRNILKALAPLKKKWFCQISINITDNPEMMNLLKESGCIGVFVGLESLHSENLKKIKKRSNYRDYSDSLNEFRKRGIMIFGSFIFGYENDTVESFKKTYSFAIKEKLLLCNLGIMNPMPGTELFDRLKKEDRLLEEKWWLSENYYWGKSVFIPENLTPEQLEKLCHKYQSKFRSFKSMLKRFFDNGANIAHPVLFWAVNISSGREYRLTYKTGLSK